MEGGTLDEAALRAGLALSGARLTPGLTEAEFNKIEATFGFQFAPDHRALLSIALPIGGDRGSWPDWRNGAVDELRGRLGWPIEGILFDVEHNVFWHPDWPERPEPLRDALLIAEERLRAAPCLAPLFAHRYVPTDPSEAGNPVFSVYQTDIIYYGADVLDWFEHEFQQKRDLSGEPKRVPFWTWFVEDMPHEDGNRFLPR